MKAILFCANPYAFGILKPLHDELVKKDNEVLWYVPNSLASEFPWRGKVNQTDSIKDLSIFKSDAIFVPGNEVPHYLRGVKVQVFHGLAGEKQGHFRIRNYFDLYLTQGPYFTKGFLAFQKKHNDFEVTETGWCKLDPLFQHHTHYLEEREALLKRYGKKNLVLYAPTFSPSLTSAPTAIEEIGDLADKQDIHLLVKFHDLMNSRVVESYKRMTASKQNMEVIDDPNILKYMIMADVMISDTSSVVYEFILLNKPVITINSISTKIGWRNILSSHDLVKAFESEIKEDPYRENRNSIITQYHPYTDGKSSTRMIAAVEEYIKKNGVPEMRRLNLYRRYKMNRMFGARLR